MPDLDILAVLVATVVAFIISGAYYALLGGRLPASPASDDERRPSPSTVAVELLRSLTVTVVVAGLAAATGADGLVAGLALGLALWVGFPLVLWIGAVFHEGTPRTVALIHAGDWLLKVPLIAVIVAAWP